MVSSSYQPPVVVVRAIAHRHQPLHNPLNEVGRIRQPDQEWIAVGDPADKDLVKDRDVLVVATSNVALGKVTISRGLATVGNSSSVLQHPLPPPDLTLPLMRLS